MGLQYFSLEMVLNLGFNFDWWVGDFLKGLAFIHSPSSKGWYIEFPNAKIL